MKDQYFGDISDYRKYGLLRSINHATNLHFLIAWLLTPDDGSSDGKFTSYLSEEEQWAKYDSSLFFCIQDLLSGNRQRKVRLIENSPILGNTKYYSEYVPDRAAERRAWFRELSTQVQSCDFIFLDPDNGMEVKSKPYGRKSSSKYLYWKEVESLWNQGKSLLIYQHFIREKRTVFIQRMLCKLAEHNENSLVGAFSTQYVVFLMALQPRHHHFHMAIVNSVQEKWGGQIRHWDLVNKQVI